MSANLKTPPKTKPPKPKASAKEGSPEARKLAAAILEVLAGVRKPLDSAKLLGVSLPRYYQLEERALHGMVAGCEIKPKGRSPTEAGRIAELERQLLRVERDCARQQALARLVQRTAGLPPPPGPTSKPFVKGKRRRRPVVRALRAVAGLRENSAAPADSAGNSGTATLSSAGMG